MTADDEGPGPLDRLVELAARAMDALGLNGRRLLWRWTRHKQSLAERRQQAKVLLRSARGPHRMCPSCRALVPRTASRCSECGASLSAATRPGFGRLLSQVFPGVTATTSLILLTNGFWFILMLMAQMRSGDAGGGMGLLGGFNTEILIRFGSGLSFYVPQYGTGGEWWRLITPIFLHAGLLHFFFNSYLLLQLGPIAQDIYGARRFWVIYLCSGIAGAATSEFVRPVNTVGASGAIMGIIGLLLVYGLRRGSVLGQNMKNFAIRLGIYVLVLGLFFNIDNWNHAGGMACGALAALVVPAGPARNRRAALLWEVLSAVGVLVVVIAFYEAAQQARS